MDMLTHTEKTALDRGMAEWHDGRLIPIMRGAETPEADALGGFQPEAPPAAPEAPPAATPPPAAEPEPAPQPAALDEDRLRAMLADVVDERLQMMPGPQAPPVQPEHPGQPPLPEWDPYDPQVVMAYNARMLDERFAQIMPQMQGMGEIADYVAEREAEGELSQYWENLAKPEGEGGVGGEFDRDMARARAEAYVESNMPIERALTQAAKDQRAYESGLQQRAVEEYIERARKLGEGGPDAVGDGAPPVTPAPQNDLDRIREARKNGEDPFNAQLAISMERHGVGSG